MNKLHTILLTTLFCTTHIFSMIDQPIIPKEENFSLKNVLYLVAERPKKNSLDNHIRLIRSVSMLNKAYYTCANNPIVTRNTINYLVKTYTNERIFIRNIINYGSNYQEEEYKCVHEIIAKKLSTPGSNNYTTWSKKLFSKTITATKIREFVEEGADVNYTTRESGYWPTRYSPTFLLYLLNLANENNNQLDTLKTALSLGADINKKCLCDRTLPLEKAMNKNLIEVIQLFLRYKPEKICFSDAIHYAKITGNNDILDMIEQRGIDLNEGLSRCLSNKIELLSSSREKKIINLLKYFLDKGADPSPTILSAYETIFENIKKQSKLDCDIISEFETLCSYGGYNEETLQQAYLAKEKIDRVIELLENNKPHK